MITGGVAHDAELIIECLDRAKKHYRVALRVWTSDLFSDGETHEILPSATAGQMQHTVRAIKRTLKATGVNLKNVKEIA